MRGGLADVRCTGSISAAQRVVFATLILAQFASSAPAGAQERGAYAVLEIPDLSDTMFNTAEHAARLDQNLSPHSPDEICETTS